jgi:hypothetical protein
MTEQYAKTKEAYLNYLDAYKKLNKGTLKGATPFAIFYLYKTYIIRYMDPQKINSNTYK